MAGPLTGIGSQPLAYQASQSQQSVQTAQQGLRQPEEQRETKPEQVKPQGAPANESQNTETGNTDVTRQAEFSVANDRPDRQVENDPTAQRGSLIDIAV